MDRRKEDGRLEEGDFIPSWLEDVKVLAGDEAVASSNVVLVLYVLVRRNRRGDIWRLIGFHCRSALDNRR